MAWDRSLEGLFALNIVMIVLSTVSVAVRFWCRAVISECRYGLDDWLCLAAMCPTVSLAAMGILMVRNGLKQEGTPTPAEQMDDLRCFFVCCILFSLILGLTKLSTLAFYKRVFGHLKHQNPLTWTVPFYLSLIVNIGGLVTSLAYIIFRCNPVTSAWDPTVSHNTCISTKSTYILTIGFINLFEDITLILLPIPQIVNLALSPQKKFLVTAMLVLGSCIPLICIGRIATVLLVKRDLNQNFAYFTAPFGYWVIAEPSVSLFAISLPAWFYLIKRGRKHGLRSLFTTQLYRRKDPYHITFEGKRPHPLIPPFALANHSAGRMSSYVHAGPGSSLDLTTSTDSEGILVVDENGYPTSPEVIHVKREFDVRYHG